MVTEEYGNSEMWSVELADHFLCLYSMDKKLTYIGIGT